MKHTLESAVEAGILDKTVHERLLADAQHFCERAGIDTSWLYVPLSHVVDPIEKKFVDSYQILNAKGVHGLCYIGTWPDIGNRMSAITAAFMRCFVDARVCTLAEAIKSGDLIRASVLCITNPPVSQYQRDELTTLLTAREVKRRKTVLMVPSLDEGEIGETLLAKIKYGYPAVKQCRS